MSREVMEYDVLIVGGGPAGYQCAMLLRSWGFECHIYEMKDVPGGFLTLGIPKYRLPRHVVNHEMERIHSLAGITLHLNCEIGNDIAYEELEKRHDEVIIAAGAWKPYRLELANEEKPWVWYGEDFLEEQITGRFKGQPKKVVVVGGGNTAVEEALYLAQMCEHVTLVHRRDSLRAEKVMQDRLFAHPRITVLWNHVVEAVLGAEQPKAVTGVRVRHVHNGEAHDLKVDGLFVAIGHDPATEIFRGHLDMDGEGYVLTRPGSTRTSVEGVFAAGDVQDKIYRQAVTAAGSGCMAALDAERFLAGLG